MSPTGVLHNRRHVCKVQVDDHPLGIAHQFGNGGDSLLQHIVGNAESVGEGNLLVGDVLQTVVGNDNQGVYLAGQLLDTSLSLTHTVGTLELEGLGHHAYRQDAGLVSQVSHDGCCAGAGAAAHAGGDEHHVGAFQNLGNLAPALLSGLLADFRLGACAHTAGELLTDLHLILTNGLVQVLLIGVDDDEIHALHTGFNHTVNNIVTGAADTDNLNFHNALLKLFSHILLLLCMVC